MEEEAKETGNAESNHEPHHHHEHAQAHRIVREESDYKKTYTKAFLVYLAIALVMFWTITINVTTFVTNGYGDVHQSLFNLWWVPYSLVVLHQSPYFTHLLYYPVGANLATQTLSPIAALIISPIYFFASPALAYNILFFTAFALSGLFMFMLAKYITKNNYAAFIAGLIFAFSPTHVAQSTAHLDWTMIEFIPLFILFYMLALREKKLKYAILAGLSFALLTFLGDIQQGLLTFSVAVILTIAMFAMDLKKKELLNLGTLKAMGLTIAFGVIFMLPFIALLLPHLSAGAFSVAQQDSTVEANMQWSDNLESYFLPSFYNGIFNGISHSYLSIYELTYQGIQYEIDIGERVSYLGYSVIALALLGLYYDFKNSKLRNSALWIVLLVIFGWLSLGPYIQMGTTVTHVPTIYFLYRDIPFLNIIREPGRMDFVVTIALAIIAAIGFAGLSNGKDKKTSYTYLAIFAALILIEYNGMPLTSSYIANSSINVTIPSAYYQIGKLSSNFTVLILPAISNSSSTPNLYTGTATYYVTAMKKPIEGGYTSRENSTQSLAVSSIPIATAAWYLEQGTGLIYPSPIRQNFTNLTDLFLAEDNIGFVSVQRSAYNLQELEQLYAFLNSAYGQPVYSSNSTFLFSTSHALSTSAGRSIVAYQVGNWTAGYNLCPSSQCNTTLQSMWWGSNARGIIVFSPKDQVIHMSFSAVTPINGTVLALYLNSFQQQAGSVVLYGRTYNYTVNMTVPEGLSEILLYTQLNSNLPSPLLAYGLENITFT